MGESEEELLQAEASYLVLQRMGTDPELVDAPLALLRLRPAADIPMLCDALESEYSSLKKPKDYMILIPLTEI